MNERTPIYVSELQSIRYGISQGWYTLDDNGNPHSGPFLSRESCLKDATRQAHDGGSAPTNA